MLNDELHELTPARYELVTGNMHTTQAPGAVPHQVWDIILPTIRERYPNLILDWKYDVTGPEQEPFEHRHMNIRFAGYETTNSDHQPVLETITKRPWPLPQVVWIYERGGTILSAWSVRVNGYGDEVAGEQLL